MSVLQRALAQALREASRHRRAPSQFGAVEVELDADTLLAARLESIRVAADAGDIEAMRPWLDADASDENGVTALMLAAQNGHAEAVRLLLDAGANADAQIEGGATAAKLARKHGHKDIARMLIAAGASGGAMHRRPIGKRMARALFRRGFRHASGSRNCAEMPDLCSGG